MTLELTEAEHALVAEIVRSEYQDLREEIVKTDSSHYKEMLHARERALEGILKKLEEG